MKHGVSEAQERLWGEDTVALGRGPEAKPESSESVQSRTLPTDPERRRARVLAGCAVALAFMAAVAILGGNRGQHTARQPASSEIGSAHQRTEPRTSVRAPRTARRRWGHGRHPIAKGSRPHRKRNPVPVPEAEPVATPPPAEPAEGGSEASTTPPASPPPEPAGPAPPTSPSTEFGIEGNGD